MLCITCKKPISREKIDLLLIATDDFSKGSLIKLSNYYGKNNHPYCR
jgi:hypothetical protein